MWQWLSTVGKKNKNGRLLCNTAVKKKKKKKNIVLIVPDDLSNGNPECNGGIQNYSEVTAGQGEAATQS